MKIKFKKILSALLVAATAKVTASPSIVNGQSETQGALTNGGGNQISVKDKKKLLQKYIIKFGSDNSYVIAGHRSHRSHSSHRSHRSSSSGGYDYTPSKSSTYSSNTSASKNSTTKTLVDTSSKEKQMQQVSTRPTVKTSDYFYNLGDRTISLGACGTDVKILAALLVKHGFLAQESLENNLAGYPICNAPMVAAIKSFQKTVGLVVTGSADATTIRALRDYDKNN